MSISDTPTPAPTYAQLAADPEIAALLDFTPVVRKVKRPDGWTPALQRELIARIAAAGTLQQAVWQMGKHATGAETLYRVADADEFRAAWDAAIAIGRRRNRLDAAPPHAGAVPGITRRRGTGAVDERGEPDLNGNFRQPGQRLNHLGEWESGASIERRGEEAAESIRNKLLRCRRMYLCSIASDAGKRAAFEILTELPIDWDLARKGEPQPDEPWRPTSQREPDWVLTADSGWSFGEIGYGPDKLAEARRVLNEVRAKRGEEPLEWDAT